MSLPGVTYIGSPGSSPLPGGDSGIMVGGIGLVSCCCLLSIGVLVYLLFFTSIFGFSEIDSCGSLWKKCEAPTNSVAACTDAECAFTCNDGYVKSGKGCVEYVNDCSGGCDAPIGSYQVKDMDDEVFFFGDTFYHKGKCVGHDGTPVDTTSGCAKWEMTDDSLHKVGDKDTCIGALDATGNYAINDCETKWERKTS